MKETMVLLKVPFESSVGPTKQWVDFARVFKRELKAELDRNVKVKRFEFHRGHFYCFGFFQTLDDRVFYWSIGDVRSSTIDDMLIRTAESFKDYTGGRNCYIKIQPDMFKFCDLPR